MPQIYNAVDAHTHLDFPVFDGDRDEVLDRARAAGVTGVVLAGADPEHWARVLRLSSELDVPCALGVHPWWVAERGLEQLQADLDHLAAQDAIDGIGETGLDWFKARSEGPDRELQRASFAAHVELAHQRGLPLVLHVVRAHADALGMLAALDVPAAGGMIHAWSAGPEWVEPALDLGLHLSFGPDLARSESVRQALALVPDQRLLLETDSPDRPLGDHDRGEPAHLVQIARLAAEIRDTTPEAILELSGQNARSLFGWELDV